MKSLSSVLSLGSWPIMLAATLAGCGGDAAQPTSRHLGDAYVHFSLPGSVPIESLYAVMLSQPERNFDELKVQGSASAIYSVQAAADELFMLYAKDLDDAAQ